MMPRRFRAQFCVHHDPLSQFMLPIGAGAGKNPHKCRIPRSGKPHIGVISVLAAARKISLAGAQARKYITRTVKKRS
jgi:hypothetical protein